MTTYLREILNTRGLADMPAPLWRLKLSDDEYKGLKGVLVDIFNRESSFRSCPKESALFYAEWWKRNDGDEGNEPFLSLGKGSDKNGCKDLLENAKRIFDEKEKSAYVSGARLVTTQRGREFKYSLLYQGGVPMGRVCSKKGNGLKWRSFIPKFILNNIDLAVVPGAIIARKTLKEYMNVLVNAGREHKPEGMPFACNQGHVWYKIVVADIKDVDKQRELHPLSFSENS